MHVELGLGDPCFPTGWAGNSAENVAPAAHGIIPIVISAAIEQREERAALQPSPVVVRVRRVHRLVTRHCRPLHIRHGVASLLPHLARPLRRAFELGPVQLEEKLVAAGQQAGAHRYVGIPGDHRNTDVLRHDGRGKEGIKVAARVGESCPAIHVAPRGIVSAMLNGECCHLLPNIRTTLHSNAVDRQSAPGVDSHPLPSSACTGRPRLRRVQHRSGKDLAARLVGEDRRVGPMALGRVD